MMKTSPPERDILIVAHFCSDLDGTGNNRFNYLANALCARGRVELVTSDFSHAKKARRAGKIDTPYTVTLLHEPGYKKNVSFARLASHAAFGRSLRRYLATRRAPDLLYCAVPSLDAAQAAAVWAKKNKVRFIIDVQDLWPEAFKLVFRVPLLSDLLFLPMQLRADAVYRTADAVVAVSETYADRAMRVNQKCAAPTVVYLGTELCTFDRCAAENRVVRTDDQIWLAYIGTLGHSYDLRVVMDALVLCRERGCRDIRFMVMGDGPLRAMFEEYARARQINVLFTGRLPYARMVGLLCACDIAVNPIAAGSAGSIINKHGDYAAAGLPVINTQECMEYRTLLSEYDCGVNCSADPREVSAAIEALCADDGLRAAMGARSRRLAEARFDRGTTYANILEIIDHA